MKILVFSDSHGKDATIERALRLHAQDASLALHAGDGAHSFLLLSRQYPSVAFRAVCGNRDTRTSFFGEGLLDEEELISVGGHRILLTHGHKHSVKFSPTPLRVYAASKGADIVVFGHTHMPYETYIPDGAGASPIRLFNPGAAKDGCYGIIDIRDNGILMQHALI